MRPKFQTLMTPQKKILQSIVEDFEDQIDTCVVKNPTTAAKTITTTGMTFEKSTYKKVALKTAVKSES